MLQAFDQPSKKLEIDILSSLDSKTFVPPLHLYEKPIKFENEQQHIMTRDTNDRLSDIPNVSSSRTQTISRSTRSRGTTHRNRNHNGHHNRHQIKKGSVHAFDPFFDADMDFYQ